MRVNSSPISRGEILQCADSKGAYQDYLLIRSQIQADKVLHWESKHYKIRGKVHRAGDLVRKYLVPTVPAGKGRIPVVLKRLAHEEAHQCCRYSPHDEEDCGDPEWSIQKPSWKRSWYT